MPKAPLEPRRFVPTLTEVVHMPPVVAATPAAASAFPVSGAMESTRGEVVSPPLPETSLSRAEPTVDAAPEGQDVEALVSRVCAAVMQALDDHIRVVVAEAMQTQHLLLVQSLRGQITPMVEASVRDALVAEMGHGERQTGESCIQATE